MKTEVQIRSRSLLLNLVLLLALALWSSGCSGGGGGTVGSLGSEGSGLNSPGSSPGTTGGNPATLDSSAPPPPPSLTVPLRAQEPVDYVPGKVLVKLREPVLGRGVSAVRDLPVAARSMGLRVTREREYKRLRAEKVRIDSGQTVEEAVELLSQLPEVEIAEPDYIVRASELLPNDSGFSDLWALKNTGQAGGVVGADIQATSAWDLQTGSSDIVVAVIDTGVNYNHPDLAANMWRNPGEVNGTPGVDDDNNGYIDDIYGINAITDSGDPLDDVGHGSHVAGTIGAVGGNSIGVVGVAFNTKIMALKFLSSDGTGTVSDAITCIDYAIAEGAHITNNSWGGPGFSTLLRSAIVRAANNNLLFIAASGNTGEDVDSSISFREYPAAFDNDNIISVGYSTRSERIGDSSSTGQLSVDLFAPGESILSTVLGSNYSVYSGSSMATPHVTGVAALMVAELGAPTPYSVIRDRILDNVEKLPAYAGRCVTGGRLNALYALDPDAASTPTPTPSPTATPSPTSTPALVQNAISLRAGWNLFSFPVRQVTELTLPAAAQSKFWVWDCSRQSYEPIQATPTSINAGDGTKRGFWVYSESVGSLGFRGPANESSTLTLCQGWNLIGCPRTEGVATDQMSVKNPGNEPASVLSSVACSELPGGDTCLLFQYLFYWTGAYANLDAVQGGSLQPRSAYWVYAWKPIEIDFFPITTSR